MEAVTVSGQIRTDLGKKATKAIRAEGQIPAVLYSKDDVIHFTTTQKAVKSLVFTSEFKVGEIAVEGKSYRCIVKEIQWHPVTDEIVHIDFLRLIDGHPIKLQIPVVFKGTSPGIRAGGKLQQAVRRISVKTVPEKIVSKLVLDISKLELGQSIRVRDIEAVEGLEIMNPPGMPVASIEIPRALRSAATAEKKAAAGGTNA
jgi:large subunit ribosomal protein L25